MKMCTQLGLGLGYFIPKQHCWYLICKIPKLGIITLVAMVTLFKKYFVDLVNKAPCFWVK